MVKAGQPARPGVAGQTIFAHSAAAENAQMQERRGISAPFELEIVTCASAHLARQCPGNSEAERSIVDQVRAGRKRQSGTQHQRGRQLEPGTAPEEQVIVGRRSRVAIQLGACSRVTERHRGERKEILRLAHRHRSAERSSERERLRAGVHAGAANINGRTKTERKSSAGAHLPRAPLLKRHRVAETAIQDDTVSADVVVTHHADRAAGVPALRMSNGKAATKRGRVVAHSHRAADVSCAVAEREVALTHLRSCRGRADRDACHRTYKITELHMASRPGVIRFASSHVGGRADLAHPLDDAIVGGVTGKGCSGELNSCALRRVRSSVGSVVFLPGKSSSAWT